MGLPFVPQKDECGDDKKGKGGMSLTAACVRQQDPCLMLGWASADRKLFIWKLCLHLWECYIGRFSEDRSLGTVLLPCSTADSRLAVKRTLIHAEHTRVQNPQRGSRLCFCLLTAI